MLSFELYASVGKIVFMSQGSNNNCLLTLSFLELHSSYYAV